MNLAAEDRVRHSGGKEMSGKKGASVAGTLLNTFGTILLLTVITICTLNFIKDARGYQMLTEQAPAKVEKTETKDKATATADNKKTKEASTQAPKQTQKPKKTEKPASDSDKKAAGSSKDGNTGADKGKQILPGEEP